MASRSKRGGGHCIFWQCCCSSALGSFVSSTTSGLSTHPQTTSAFFKSLHSKILPSTPFGLLYEWHHNWNVLQNAQVS